MNREQKATAIAEIATHIEQSRAIFAVDYRGISVPEAAELRADLRDANATFKVVKNSLTERAADQVGAEVLKGFLAGPTALAFVHGDVATAAKAIADRARVTHLLPFKGGLMDGATLDPEQIRSISVLPSRDALYGQLVGVVSSPVTGLVRTLGALIGGLAVALGQVREQKESGQAPAGAPPAAQAPAETPKSEEPAAEEPAAEEHAAEEPAAEEPATEEPAAEEPTEGEPQAEAVPEAAPSDQAEPEGEPAQDDDNEAGDASAEAQPEASDAKPTKED
jgi:large subunit ribosomal protein L10